MAEDALVNLRLRVTVTGAKDADGQLKGLAVSGVSADKSMTNLRSSLMNLVGGFSALMIMRKVTGLLVEHTNQMAQAGIMAGISGKELDDLGDRVLTLAGKYSLSANDVRRALYEIYSAQVPVEQGMATLETTMKAAEAGNAGVNDTFRLGSAIIKGYGMQWSELPAVYDKTMQIVIKGQTTFSELAQSMGAVIPMAKAGGISLEELSGFYATLTGVTGNASEVTTQMRQVIASIVKPTQDARQGAKAMGIDFSAAALKSKGLAGVLDDVAKATGGDIDKIAILFPNIRALPAVLAATGGQAGQLAKNLDTMKNSAGSVDTAMKNVSASVGEHLETLKTRGLAALTKLALGLAPIFENIVGLANGLLSVLTPIIEVFGKMPAPIKTVAIAFVVLAIAQTKYNALSKLSTVLNRDMSGSFSMLGAKLDGAGRGILTLASGNVNLRKSMNGAFSETSKFGGVLKGGLTVAAMWAVGKIWELKGAIVEYARATKEADEAQKNFDKTMAKLADSATSPGQKLSRATPPLRDLLNTWNAGLSDIEKANLEVQSKVGAFGAKDAAAKLEANKTRENAIATLKAMGLEYSSQAQVVEALGQAEAYRAGITDKNAKAAVLSQKEIQAAQEQTTDSYIADQVRLKQLEADMGKTGAGSEDVSAYYNLKRSLAIKASEEEKKGLNDGVRTEVEVAIEKQNVEKGLSDALAQIEIDRRVKLGEIKDKGLDDDKKRIDEELKATQEANIEKANEEEKAIETWMDARRNQHDWRINNEQDALKKIIDNENTSNEDRLKAEEQYWTNKLIILIAGGLSAKDAQERIDAEKEISDEERAQREIERAIRVRDAKIQKWLDYVNAVNNLGNAYFDMQLARVSEQERKETEAAKARGATEAELDAIKNKFAAKELALKKKQRIVKYSEAVSSSALAIINAFQTKPFFPLGLIMGSIATGIMGMQLATIAAQPYYKGGILEPGKTGFFEGTRRELIVPLEGAGSFMDFARTELAPMLFRAPNSPAGASSKVVNVTIHEHYDGTFLGDDIAALREYKRTTDKRANLVKAALEGVGAD
jgi:TP901 family phage tail tape measure protein